MFLVFFVEWAKTEARRSTGYYRGLPSTSTMPTENSTGRSMFEMAIRHDHMQYPTDDTKQNMQAQRWDWPWLTGWGYYTKERIMEMTHGRKVTHLKITSPVCLELVEVWAPHITHLRISNPSDKDVEDVLKMWVYVYMVVEPKIKKFSQLNNSNL